MEEDSEEEQWMKSLEPDPLLNEGSGPGSTLEKQETQAAADSHVSRMELNTNKAGMDGLDKERINKIIMEASVGSRYYENEQKKEKQVNQKIEKLLYLKSRVTTGELKAAKMKVDKLVKDLERSRDLSRTIVHIDMDMFYAAVEMLEKPELRTKPMAVGGTHMMSTSNYVARRYGVRAGMPGFIGLKLCPDLVLVPTNFAKYREYSDQVREILAEYDPNLSVMSLDEAYLDFTDHLERRKSMSDKERTFMRLIDAPQSDEDDKPSDISSERDKATSETGTEDENKYDEGKDEESHTVDSVEGDELPSEQSSGVEPPSEAAVREPARVPSEGQRRVPSEGQERSPSSSSGQPVVFGISKEDAVNEMRFRIHQRTKLTASAGIAPNRMLAKIASDMNKPNGQFVIKPTKEDVLDFITNLPVRKISGIGKVMERVLSAVGVKTCSHLYEERALLYKIFPAISFNHFIRISLALGSTEVGRGEERKSISTERTFREKSKPEDLFRLCQDLCDSLAREAEKKGLKLLTVKLKTVQFEVKNRSLSLMNGISSSGELFNVARDLLQAEIKACKPRPLALRLMGIRLSAFLSEEEVQGNQKQKSLMSFMKKSSPSSSTAASGKLVQGTTSAASKDPEKDKQQSETAETSLEDEIIEDYEDSRDALIQENEVKGEEEDREDRTISESHKYACPVCGKEKVYRNLEEFNQHVDICLNKGAISSILKDQASRPAPTTSAENTTTLKRASNSSSSSRKKMKTKCAGKFSTLDKFFTKHS